MTRSIAQPLSRRTIRKMAYFIRRVAHQENDIFFDIVKFLEIILPKIDPGFTFIVEEPAILGECHGLTFPDRNEIHIRSDVYDRACNGNGRDRLTMAHELFHLLQHGRENISYARVENEFAIETFRDPEWQAMAFGGELLVPWHLTQGMDEREISEKCGVSLEAARMQIRKR